MIKSYTLLELTETLRSGKLPDFKLSNSLYLLAINKGKAPTIFILPSPQSGEWSLLLGRDASCPIILQDPTVSRHHATLTLSPQGLFIQDQGSTIGTFLKGKLQKFKQYPLQTKQLFRCGETRLKILEAETLLELLRPNSGHLTRPQRKHPALQRASLPTTSPQRISAIYSLNR